jgi:hypothetical protein
VGASVTVGILLPAKERMFREAGYMPHKGQWPIHRSTARNKVVAAGRRFGKSRVGGAELFAHSVATQFMLHKLDDNRREFWIVGPNYTDSEKEFRATWNMLVKLDAPFDKPGTYNNAHDGDMQISMYHGKLLIIAKSAAHPERLVGEGLAGVVMAEAAKMRESTWSKYVRPTLADYGGWALFNSTPEGKNWFYDLWMRGQSEWETSWESWRRPAWSNNHVYRGIVDPVGLERIKLLLKQREPVSDAQAVRWGVDLEVFALLKDLTAETFAQEIEARFTQYAGRTLKDFDEEIHVRDLKRVVPTSLNKFRTFAACDYGFTNPFVWLLIQEDVFGNVYVLDEIFERGLTIEESCQLIKDRHLDTGIEAFFPDPASPGDTRYLEKHLKIRAVGGTGGARMDRIGMIRRLLKEQNTHLPVGHVNRQPRIFINRGKCPNVIREWNDWRYPKTVEEAATSSNLPEEPMKKDDHTAEALGRYLMGRQQFELDSVGARIQTADMS